MLTLPTRARAEAGGPPAERSAAASAWAHVRLHTAALGAARGRTLLAMFGLMLGVALAVAVTVVVAALERPFAGYAGLPDPPDLQLRPRAEHALDEGLYRDVRTVLGIDAAPVSGGPIVIAGPGGSAGILLVGATCEAARFMGPAACTSQEQAAPPPSPGLLPLWTTPTVAGALGADVGDPISVPGRSTDAAYVAGMVAGDSAAAVNGGNVAFGLVPDVAALVGHPGELGAILVRARGADAESNLREAVGDAAIVDRPASFEPPILQAARRAILLNGAIAIAVGLLVAATTLVTVFTDRQHSLAVFAALGATRSGIAAGLIAEGAAIGAVAAVLGFVPGLVAGQALAARFGETVLSGTGVVVHGRFAPVQVLVAFAIGVFGGCAAAAISAWATMRRPVLDVLADASRFAMPGRPRYGLVPAGLVLLAVGMAVAVPFGAGSLPLAAGFAALALMPVGFALLVMGATPALVALYRSHIPIRAASGLLARSELSRSPVQTGSAVVILALAVSTFAPSMNLRTYASEAIARRGHDLIGGGLLVGARRVGEQSNSVLGEDALAGVAAMPGVAGLTPVLRAPLELATPAVVVGLPAGSALLESEASRSGLGADQIAAMRAGGVVVSSIAASHLHVGAGDSVVLPVRGGHARFTVVGVADPSFVDDTGIGDAIVADAQVAKDNWDATPTFALATLDAEADAPAVAERIDRTYSGRVAAMTAGEFDALSSETVARFLAPVISLGWVVVLAAAIGVLNLFVLGLLQRRRERALHRAMGMETAQEYATTLTESVVVGVLGAAFGAVATLVFSLQLSIVAPVFLTTSVGWRPLAGPLAVAVLGAIAAALAGVLAPLLQGRRDDVAALLSDDP